MPSFEIDSSTEFGPYSAVIGATDDFNYGQIRIEPPVHVSNDFLEAIKDYGFNLEHEMTDENCTVITFFDPFVEAEEAPVETKRELINEISIAFFKATW